MNASMTCFTLDTWCARRECAHLIRCCCVVEGLVCDRAIFYYSQRSSRATNRRSSRVALCFKEKELRDIGDERLRKFESLPRILYFFFVLCATMIFCLALLILSCVLLFFVIVRSLRSTRQEFALSSLAWQFQYFSARPCNHV